MRRSLIVLLLCCFSLLGGMPLQAAQDTLDEAAQYLAQAMQIATQPGQTGKALQYTEKALKIYADRSGKQCVAYANALTYRAYVKHMGGQLTAAERDAQQAVRIFDALGRKDIPEYAFTIAELGSIHLAAGNTELAEKELIQGLQVYYQLPGDTWALTSHWAAELGRVYLTTKDYPKAVVAWEQAYEGHTRSGDTESPQYASVLSGMMYSYLMVGQFQKALPINESLMHAQKALYGEHSPQYRGSVYSQGALCMMLNNPEKGEAAFKEYVRLVGQDCGTDTGDYATALQGLAGVYDITGDYDEALGLYDKALAIWQKQTGEQSVEYATALRDKASILIKVRHLAEAEKFLTSAITVFRKSCGAESVEYVACLSVLAKLYDEEGLYKRALELYEQVAAIRGKIPSQRCNEYILCLISLATAYQQLDLYGKAEETVRRIVDLSAELGDDSFLYSSSHRAIGTLYSDMGQYEKAEKHLALAGAWVKKVYGDNTYFYAEYLTRLVELKITQGKYAEVEPLCFRILDIITKDENAPAGYSLDCREVLCDFYITTGQFDKAEPLLLDMMAQQEELGLTTALDRADLQELQVKLYMSMGRLEETEAILTQLLDVYAKAYGDNNTACAKCYAAQAVSQLTQKKYPQAIQTLQRALRIYQEALGETHPFVLRMQCALANAYLLSGESGQAGTMIHQALVRVQPDARPLQASLLLTKAGIALSTADHGTAEQCLKQAQGIFADLYSGEQNRDTSACLSSLAICAVQKGDVPAALKLQAQAMEVMHGKLLQVLAACSESAMYGYFDATSADISHLISIALSAKPCAPETEELIANWVLKRKNIIFDTIYRLRLAQRYAREHPELARLQEEYQLLRQRETNLSVHAGAAQSPEDARKELAALRAQINQTEVRINQWLAKLNLGTANVSISAVRAKLPAGSVLLEFVRAGVGTLAPARSTEWATHYFVLVIPPTGAVRMVDLGEAEAIEAAISNLRESMESAGAALQRVAPEKAAEAEVQWETAYRECAQQLYRLVLAPVKSAVEGATRVYLAPDGELNRISFEALVDDAGQYLIEKHRFVYLSSGRDLLRPADPSAKGTAIFAAPDYNLDAVKRQQEIATLAPAPQATAEYHSHGVRGVRGLRWHPLPETTEEAESVTRLLTDGPYAPVACYTGKSALEDRLKRLQPPRILHIATHGFYLPIRRAEANELLTTLTGGESAFGTAQGLASLRGVENPLLRSGLVLTGANMINEHGADQGDDGWVTAEEISLMNLHGTDLVVLSACESGLGDVKSGDGVYGLRRAFLLAGAKTLITSLYPVPDKQTKELMVEFYRGLAAGKGTQDALRDAELAIMRAHREKAQAAHPFYWASFILIGESR